MQSTKDAEYLLGEGSSSELQREVMALINSTPVSSSRQSSTSASSKATQTEQEVKATQRLFELFIQREDMKKITSDFRELSAFFGKPDETDDFSWSQFKADTAEQMEKLNIAIKKAEEEQIDKMMKSLKKNQRNTHRFNEDKASSSGENDQTTDSEKPLSIVVPAESADEIETVVTIDKGNRDQTVYDDPTVLKDRDGNFWSGVILNTDMVQRVTPGDRVGSHRVLVVVGNLRGAAGFGMGKGKTPADALKGAFRAALRNLTHIDLYDNFGLAHDLYGKHNACHAYIRATPRSREMVASPFATDILTRFGIGSASVKLVGRRDPYAMVRAVFNAIEQHENIDEYAKGRGKRYLTLKWAHDQNL